MMKIKQIWDHLEAEHKESPFMRLIDSKLLTRAYAGIEGNPSRRYLKIEIPQETSKSFESFMDIKGIKTTIVKTSQEQDGFITLKIEASSSDLNAQFTAISGSLIDALTGCKTLKEYIEEVRRRVEKWKFFFKSEHAMSENSEIGLFGELYFLYSLIKAGIKEASTCWNGPLMAEHDFSTKGLSVEIKTTRANKIDQVTISSLEQLDFPDDQDLFLAVYRIRKDELNGTTLNDLIDIIEKLIPSEYVEDFKLKLSIMGCTDNCSNNKYSIIDSNVYSIGTDFPRIIKSDLPIEIKKAQYTISLGECNKFICDFNDIISKVDKI